MEKQITIIIPTYNMEKYIGKCLDSLLIPEFNQVEALVVNDGSKDRSSEIAHSYAECYPDSIRVIDKPNGNYGSCINAALPQVKGRYVKILDADDSFDNEGFSKLVRKLKDLDVDVVFTLCKDVDENGNITGVSGKFKVNRYNHVYDDINSRLSDNTLMHWMAYNTRVFSRFNYHQPEGISYTDNIWAFIPIIYCKTGIFLDFVVYKYLLGRQGQTMDVQSMLKQLDHFRLVAKAMVDYYVQFKENKEIRDIAKKNTLAVVTCIYNLFTQRFKTKESYSLLAKFDSDLCQQAPEIYDAINDYNIYKSVDYKIYAHLRASNYDLNMPIPKRIELKRRFLLHKHGAYLRLMSLIYKISGKTN